MGATEFARGSAQAVQRWSNKLARETLDKMWFKKFSGTSENNIIQVHKDLNSQPGELIKYDVLYQNRGDGVAGDTTLEGYEEELEFYQDQLYVDQLRNAHNFRRMSQQRSVHDMRKVARFSLSNWFAWKLDTMMFAYLAGVAGNDTENCAGTLGASGFASNALQVSDAAHHLNKTGSTMTLTFVDTLVAWAKTTNPRMVPVNTEEGPRFVLVLHPYQVAAMKAEVAENKWSMIHARVAELGSKNPIYTGALGEYNGVILHESEWIPRSTNTLGWSGAVANDTAAVFLGAQAGAFAMGNAYTKMDQVAAKGGSYFRWDEESKDYGNNKGIAAASCFGIKKNRFNSADFAVIRLTTTDARPT